MSQLPRSRSVEENPTMNSSEAAERVPSQPLSRPLTLKQSKSSEEIGCAPEEKQQSNASVSSTAATRHSVHLHPLSDEQRSLRKQHRQHIIQPIVPESYLTGAPPSLVLPKPKTPAEESSLQRAMNSLSAQDRASLMRAQSLPVSRTRPARRKQDPLTRQTPKPAVPKPNKFRLNPLHHHTVHITSAPNEMTREEDFVAHLSSHAHFHLPKQPQDPRRLAPENKKAFQTFTTTAPHPPPPRNFTGTATPFSQAQSRVSPRGDAPQPATSPRRRAEKEEAQAQPFPSLPPSSYATYHAGVPVVQMASPPSPEASHMDEQMKRDIKGESEYQRYLEMSRSQNYEDMKALNMLYRCGIDKQGRPVIVFVACNIPAKKIDPDRFLLFIISVMDKLADNDYTFVFVNTLATSDNRPTFKWMRKAYSILNRKYKKNLKALYIVHPQFWTKMIFRLFKPFISSKFWKKLTYIDRIGDLYQFIDRDQIDLPDKVMQYRPEVRSKPVFGAQLRYAVQQNIRTSSGLPLVVEQCIDYLYKHALDVEGIFRLSGNSNDIQDLKRAYDREEEVELESAVNDPSVVAGLLKQYLRELPQPLFTFDLYDTFITAQQAVTTAESKAEEQRVWLFTMRSLVAALPVENQAVLKHLLALLHEVNSRSAVNKMSSSNLAIVFAPNLLRMRSEEESIAVVMEHTPVVNEIVKTLIERFEEFYSESNQDLASA